MEIKVPLQEMENVIPVIQEDASELAKELVSINNVIAEMNTTSQWRGKRYNELVTAYNSAVVDMNDAMELTQKDLPEALVSIVRAYSSGDTQTRNVSVDASASRVDTLAETNVDEIIINTATVEAKGNEMKNSFEKAVKSMENIESNINKLQWEGTSAENFKSRIKMYKDNIEACFNNIASNYSIWVNETIEELSSAESSVDIG